MNEETARVLEDLLTDIKVELESVCLALQQKDIPRETINSLRGEVDEKAIREEVREKLIRALFT